MKIKICCVDEDGRYGGPQSRMIDVYKGIDKKKFDYSFLIPKNVKIFKKKIISVKAKFYEADITRLAKEKILALKYIFFLPFEMIFLKKFFEEKKFDLIQVNGIPHFKTILAAKLSNIKSVWIIEDSYSPKNITLVFRLFVKLFNPNIVYISDKVKNFYLKNFDPKKIHCYKIMSPTDTSFFIKKKNKKFNNKKNLNIVSVSGIIDVKDVETFLQVAIKIISKNNNVNFIFAGKGTNSEKKYYKKIMSFYDNLEKKIKKKIKFIGMTSDVKKLLKNTDIFLCTSKSEGGPITVWEAMSMQLPVVTTKVGGTTEFIVNGYNGFLCKIGNVSEISKKIEILLKNKILRHNLGLRARKTAVRHLDYKKISKNYEKIYEHIYRKI